ncbi:formin-like protein 19 [Geospiza fortis]|uniref:Formin-like protein 19 n=1 Tax=Geospiza fortis TaxID=48883 RepID=A0A6I9HLZ6_GEOFO|nr:formin-like protein 19 [Geospiza fortis]
MVKNKEVSIEGALHLAQKEVYAEKDPQDLLTGSQFNFIIYKYKHYRWQKRILQLDFSSRTIFNIEKGTIRKQFPFSQVRGCEDSERRRFSILFHGRQHYELEAVSLEDKRKVGLRVPLSVQSSSPEAAGRLRREWLSLLGRHCQPGSAAPLPLQGSAGRSSPEADYEECVAPLSEQREETARCGGGSARSSLRNPAEPAEGQAAPAAALPPALGRAQVPPAPPALPQPCSVPPAAKRTKAFHWDLVPWDKIQKSVWGSCDPCKRKIDVCRLCEQFQIQDTAVPSGTEPPVNQHILLDRKVAHNFNIFLKSFRVKPSELKDKLFIIHEESGGLTDEQITALRRYLPTPKDAERYLSFKGPCSELHVVDQFMLEMCKIPQLGQRLDLLLSIRELPESIRDLEPLIAQNIQASKQLQSSPKFVAVLEYILAMGNHLNEKAGKEVAKGFRLSSLAKLSLLRGRDRTFTLLHALVEQILSHQPELATFPQELTEFEAVPDASMKGLSAEVDVLRKELENLIQCRRLLKPKASKATPQESQFCKELKDLIQKYEGDLSQLSKRCEEMKKLYSNVLVRFGEPADLDSQELFGWICSFICEFRKACAELTP